MPAPRQRLLSVNSIGHWKPVIFIASRIYAAVPRGQAWVPCGSMTTDGYPRQSPHIFPLHDDKHHATTLRRMRRNFFSFRMNGKIKPILDEWKWWSQTGSNRRPHACKARALPAELWPLFMAHAPHGLFRANVRGARSRLRLFEPNANFAKLATRCRRHR